MLKKKKEDFSNKLSEKSIQKSVQWKHNNRMNDPLLMSIANTRKCYSEWAQYWDVKYNAGEKKLYIEHDLK